MLDDYFSLLAQRMKALNCGLCSRGKHLSKSEIFGKETEAPIRRSCILTVMSSILQRTMVSMDWNYGTGRQKRELVLLLTSTKEVWAQTLT